MEANTTLMIVDEQSLKDKIYVVRGKQVMLDFDLAEIYGYETKYFNRQVRNNAERFMGDNFMFRLTAQEYQEIMRCNNFTSSWGGARYLPNAFTEQGVYMLMTVLRGELAVKQSRALIMTFKAIKDTMLTKTELSDFMKLFDASIEQEEVLILNGEPFKADLAYQTIYQKARNTIMIIDDYISTKTLHQLTYAKQNVQFTIISDNKARPPLRKMEYADYIAENPERNIAFVTSAGKMHDRYIVLDHETPATKVYHCGASSKDAGTRITTITESRNVSIYSDMINNLLANPPLVLR